MRVTALVPAAGAGSRLGGSRPKQFIRLGDRPMLSHTLGILDAAAEIDEIILMVPPGEEERSRAECIDPFGIKKVSRILPGGGERQDSVYRGLAEVPATTDIVLVHDGARPFVNAAMIRAVIESARESGAAIAAVPVRDTVKAASADGTIDGTLDRGSLFLAQTPQAFARALLAEAHERARREGVAGTDDSVLVERIGRPVRIVPGSRENFKITLPEDLDMARRLLNGKGGGRDS